MIRTLLACLFASATLATGARPHIILVMADDMGWGQTSYYKHPVLKTPHLDAMAENGLRFDRFYAGGPVCSPTRASVLTGRSHDRTGVPSHGFPLRLQEKTIAQALQAAGYRTAHFGKWHLNGIRGPGVPVLAGDSHHPGHFGFDHWLTVTNFFDLNPIMSRMGRFEEHTGDSSEIVVDEALKHLRQHKDGKEPTFTVIWYGTPHSPFMASAQDRAHFPDLEMTSRNHHAELVAMDRSIGTLRQGLRDLGIAGNTLLWFCSDNGGLPKITPSTTGGLRGFKGSLYEGGLRVPAILEWPGKITPRISDVPAAVMDIAPTLASITGLPEGALLKPLDGVDLHPLRNEDPPTRATPIFFRSNGRLALVDNNIKVYAAKGPAGKLELYDLSKDPAESDNLAEMRPKLAAKYHGMLTHWNRSVDASVAGKDYPEGTVAPDQPERRFWTDMEEYRPFFKDWRSRPEYAGRLKKK